MAALSLAAIKHHSAEGPGRIQDWCDSHGHQLTCFMAPLGALPKLTNFDGLIILGGPTDVANNPAWMQAELELIKDAIDIDMPILAICLGAQLLATALGASLYKLEQPELGWHEVKLLSNGLVAETLMVPQWHFYGFDFNQQAQENKPMKQVSIEASSVLCHQQAFRHQRQLGLQFHPEWHELQIHSLIEHFKDDCPFDTETKPLLQQQLALWFMSLLDSMFKPNDH
ncbi:type 1 glutamine amidotransferase [Shewanella sp. 10N.286.51.B8]|uniref:type 1 glutamine amidotransferase n=1 Tax=Shewanella sp. 10N.286.51.B8 TaxID=3229708 RepID=UPI00355319EC